MTGRSALQRPPATAAQRLQRPWWPLLRRLCWTAFFGVVALLLWRQAQGIAWGEVRAALRALPWAAVALAALLAACSHALYSCFDLLGKWWTKHPLPARQVMAITFVSYAFNLNLGALVGGVAFRYRLYSRRGLGHAVIGRVLGLSLATNWLGYLVLAGLVFVTGAVLPPASLRVGRAGLACFGALLLGAALAYLAMCAWSPRRQFRLRGVPIELPRARLALLQLALSCINWMTIGAVLYVLLREQVPYFMVLGVLLAAAVAGVVTHVPAGLGVLEAVFAALLGRLLPYEQIIAALLAYRALYYLAPLVLATALFAVLEWRARRAPGPLR